MIFGNKNVFAIECEVTERIDDWVFGHFIFWLNGNSIGDWEDTTDLKGCMMWLKDFVNVVRDRFDERLITLNKDAAFQLLYNSVMQSKEVAHNQVCEINNIYSRFHITHLGMSSFEHFDILLIEQPNGRQRCIWQSAAGEGIHEFYLPNKEMQRVAQLCYTWLESKIQERDPVGVRP